jgi:hypothetical protein
MAAITVYVANLARVSEGDLSVMRNNLTRYFDRVVAGTDSTFNGVRVVTHNRGLHVSETDLICYIVPNFARGKVRHFNSHFLSREGSAGNTALFPEDLPVSAASEIYTDVIDSVALSKGLAYANLIFHELMHNKTGMGDRLHLYGGEGLAAINVREVSTLNEDNIAFMVARLNRPMRQYVASF